MKWSNGHLLQPTDTSDYAEDGEDPLAMEAVKLDVSMMNSALLMWYQFAETVT